MLADLHNLGRTWADTGGFGREEVERKEEGGAGAEEVEDRLEGRPQARLQTDIGLPARRSVQVREVNVKNLRSLTARTRSRVAHPRPR